MHHKSKLNPLAEEFFPNQASIPDPSESKKSADLKADKNPNYQQTNHTYLTPNVLPKGSMAIQKRGKTKTQWDSKRSFTNTPFNIHNLLQKVNVHPISAQFLVALAQNNWVRIKGGFAISALANSIPRSSPFRLNDLDMEVLFDDKNNWREVLEFHGLDPYILANQKSGKEFFNLNCYFISELDNDRGLFPVDVTISDRATYQSVEFDPFYWTRVRLDLDFNEGALYCRPEELPLVQQVKFEIKHKLFCVDWEMFESNPRVESGLARLIKYFYQLDYFGYRLNTPDGDIPKDSAIKYLSHKKDCAGLYKDLAGIAEFLFNLQKGHSPIYKKDNLAAHDKKWLPIILNYARLIVYEIIHKLRPELKPKRIMQLRGIFFTRLMNEIQAGIDKKKLEFPVRKLNYNFVETFTKGFMTGHHLSASPTYPRPTHPSLTTSTAETKNTTEPVSPAKPNEGSIGKIIKNIELTDDSVQAIADAAMLSSGTSAMYAVSPNSKSKGAALTVAVDSSPKETEQQVRYRCWTV